MWSCPWVQKRYVGTCLVVSWSYNAGHAGGRWAAQPTCEGVRAGNLILASSLLFSGNSYQKVGMMFKFCNIQYFSHTLFYQYQNLFIAPAVKDFWEQQKKKLWDERSDWKTSYWVEMAEMSHLVTPRSTAPIVWQIWRTKQSSKWPLLM